MSQTFRTCPDCGAERAFERHHEAQGSCPDTLDGECPEWSCTECGTALMWGFVPYRAEPASAALSVKVA